MERVRQERGKQGMKPNILFHTFYILGNFFSEEKSDIRRHQIRHFFALFLLSVCLTANVYSLIMLGELAGVIDADLSKWSIFLFLLIAIMLYLWIMEERKHEAIRLYYDKKYSTANFSKAKGWVILYVVVSLGLVLYLAELTRNIFR